MCTLGCRWSTESHLIIDVHDNKCLRRGRVNDVRILVPSYLHQVAKNYPVNVCVRVCVCVCVCACVCACVCVCVCVEGVGI